MRLTYFYHLILVLLFLAEMSFANEPCAKVLESQKNGYEKSIKFLLNDIKKKTKLNFSDIKSENFEWHEYKPNESQISKAFYTHKLKGWGVASANGGKTTGYSSLLAKTFESNFFEADSDNGFDGPQGSMWGYKKETHTLPDQAWPVIACRVDEQHSKLTVVCGTYCYALRFHK